MSRRRLLNYKGSSFVSYVPTSNLLAYYKLDEPSGNSPLVAEDSWGNNDGSFQTTNDIFGYTGKVNNCAFFQSNNIIYCNPLNDPNTLKPPSAFSTSFWMYITQRNTTFTRLVSVDSGGSNYNGWFLREVNNSGEIQLAISTTNTRINSNSGGLGNVIPIGEWHHITGTYDGALMKIYQNGTKTLEVALTGDINYSGTPGLDIGGRSAGSNLLNNTYMDEVGIWDRALTTQEIADLYNNGNGTTL